MKNFSKRLIPDGHYFARPEKLLKREVVNASETSSKLLTELLAGHEHNSIHHVTNEFVETHSYHKKDPIDLPFGSYTHAPEDHPHPERLIPTNFREDEKYINMASLDDLHTDMELFLKSEPLYAELKFSYRRGYLLYGKPGNGKTALIRELIKKYHKTAHIIWCSGVPSNRMREMLNKTDSVKIVIFEEIVSKADSRYFDMGDFLEFMDGENSMNKCITIATTNYPEKLQENLANRPSRFDVVYDVKNPTKAASYEILTDLLKRMHPVTSKDLEIKDLSFAQLKELVLLHKMYDMSLAEAQDKILKHSERFKKGFEEYKSFGLQMD